VNVFIYSVTSIEYATSVFIVIITTHYCVNVCINYSVVCYMLSVKH
jgi:hypothetical protein